jgi:hypothetical protein
MVELKRTSAAVAEPEPETSEADREFEEAVAYFHKPDDVDPALKRKLAPVAAKQLEELRAQAVANIQRLGKGAARWAEKGWEWEEPDWSESPESWPPVAKILYLLVLVDVLRDKISMLRYYAAWPEWCPECHPGEKREKGYRGTACIVHWPVARAVRQRAADFLGVEFPEEFEDA